MRRSFLAVAVLSVAALPVFISACSKKNDDMPPPPPSVGATATPTTPGVPPAVPAAGADIPAPGVTASSSAKHGTGGPGAPVTLTVPSAYASSVPSGYPTAVTLPPGMKLPPGVQLPPGFPGAPVK